MIQTNDNDSSLGEKIFTINDLNTPEFKSHEIKFKPYVSREEKKCIKLLKNYRPHSEIAYYEYDPHIYLPITELTHYNSNDFGAISILQLKTLGRVKMKQERYVFMDRKLKDEDNFVLTNFECCALPPVDSVILAYGQIKWYEHSFKSESNYEFSVQLWKLLAHTVDADAFEKKILYANKFAPLPDCEWDTESD